MNLRFDEFLLAPGARRQARSASNFGDHCVISKAIIDTVVAKYVILMWNI